MAQDPIVLGTKPDLTSRIDGVHIAVFPAVATTPVKPGTRVGICKKGKTIQVNETPIGIVDPFLKHMVSPGLRVYVWLFPLTIKGLKHTWDNLGTKEVPSVVLGSPCSAEAMRDSTHVAIQPVMAGGILLPGQRIAVESGMATVSDLGYGIVDPFLQEHVDPKSWFWMCMYPTKYKNFRHTWTHPIIDGDR